jgi:hypothetical protein
MNIIISLGLGWILGGTVYGFSLLAPDSASTMAKGIKIIAAILIILGSIIIVLRAINYNGPGAEHIAALHIYFFSLFTFLLSIASQVVINKINPRYR